MIEELIDVQKWALTIEGIYHNYSSYAADLTGSIGVRPNIISPVDCTDSFGNYTLTGTSVGMVKSETGARGREVLFLDSNVPDPTTILANLRPEVEAILLDAGEQALSQIAAALADRQNLAAIHIVAHGAPGRVCFASGALSIETLEDEARDLAAIGRALGRDCDIRLWSCHTGAGAEGAVFLARFSQATGADVSAATGPIGAGALSGRWELAVRANAAALQPPLTAAGMANYAGVLAAYEINIIGTLPNGNTTGTVTYFVTDTTNNTIVGQVVLPDAVKQNTSVSLTVKVPKASGSYAIGTFDEHGFHASSFLSVRQPPSGAVGR